MSEAKPGRAALFLEVRLRHPEPGDEDWRKGPGHYWGPHWGDGNSEGNADAHVRQLIIAQRPRAWEWPLLVQVILEQGHLIVADLAMPAQPSWSGLRNALVAHYRAIYADESSFLAYRRSARRAIQLLTGETLPEPPSERFSWSAFTRGGDEGEST